MSDSVLISKKDQEVLKAAKEWVAVMNALEEHEASETKDYTKWNNKYNHLQIMAVRKGRAVVEAAE